MILATKAEALICPACGQRAMTESQKFSLGPLRSRSCQSCGTRLTISWSDLLFVSWPMFLAPSGWGFGKLGHALVEVFDFPAGLAYALFIVFGLVVPIGIFMTIVAWACIRHLDLGPRIGLVVRGAPRPDSKSPTAS